MINLTSKQKRFLQDILPGWDFSKPMDIERYEEARDAVANKLAFDGMGPDNYPNAVGEMCEDIITELTKAIP